ncbi:MucBP domain-containing protein [Enterococcus rotai]|uniref:MucBP domain-containing protein n=1 Tax=Enterococcus rotai TaxID=118060 RepID=UPI0032B3BB1B
MKNKKIVLLSILLSIVSACVVVMNGNTKKLSAQEIVKVEEEKVMSSPIATRTIQSDLLAKLKEGWAELPEGSTEGVIENPINHSKIGFVNLGINHLYPSPVTRQGFALIDDAGESPVGETGFVPYVNNKKMYPKSSTANIFLVEAVGLGSWRGNETTFLKKGNTLREIIVDEANAVLFVYDLAMEANLNFSLKFSMYNTSNQNKKFSIVEERKLQHQNPGIANAPIYRLGKNQGIYQTNNGLRLTYKLKDDKGTWISDFTRYVVGSAIHKEPQVLGYNLISDSWFKDDFSVTGNEATSNEVLFPGYAYSQPHLQFGAPPKIITPGEAMVVGYEVFTGNEIPYMEIALTPDAFNVYDDHTDFSGNYILSKIPTVGDQGIVKFTYPDGSEEDKNYVGNATKESLGIFKIPRTSLPKVLNDDTEEIKTYYTDVLATNTKSSAQIVGLVSKEYVIPINVYKFGAKPLAQLIKKGTAFTKKAEELIEKPGILPGHAVSYSYEGAIPDTTTIGYKFANVRMTDTTMQPNKTTIIKVPFQVVDELPTPGSLYIGANDFQEKASAFEGITAEQVKEKILALSESAAWNVDTGSGVGIDLVVESTTLVPNPGPGKYTARLNAKLEGTVKQVTKDISITIFQEQNVKIAFVDDAGAALHEPIMFRGLVGSTLDLTKEATVQAALVAVDKKYYDLVTSPTPETGIIIDPDEKTVTYTFKKRKQEVRVRFIDENKKILKAGRIFSGKIGSTINVAANISVVNNLADLKADHYELMKTPENDTAVLVEPEMKIVYYEFKKIEQNINIAFVDNVGTVLHEIVTLRGPIGSTKDLTKEPTVQTVLEEVKKKKHYDLVTSPMPETGIIVDPEEKTVTYTFKKSQGMLKVTFLNEGKEPIEEPITITENVGTAVNLATNVDVQAAVKKLKTQHYELVQAPVNETSEVIIIGERSVSYEFKGMLFVKSFPSKLDFGNKYMIRPFIKGEQPKYDRPLVVADNRVSKTAWKLTATLEDSLRSVESPSEVLPRALTYKAKNAEKLYLLKGETIPIEMGQSMSTGVYNISDRWETSNTGLQLEVFSREIIQKGNYKTSILWQMGSTP